MILYVGGERQIADPSDSDIRSAPLSLDAKAGDAFLILEADQMTYIQASGDKTAGFCLEYQEGRADRHYRAKREDIPLEDLLAALVSYRDGGGHWKDKFEFERMTW